MDIRAIAFDFGNVLGFFDYTRTTTRLAPHTELSAEQLCRIIYGSALEVDYEAGKISTGEFVRLARENCALRCPGEEIMAAWADIFHPNQETLALLPRLKHRYRLLLASNTNELHSRQFTTQFEKALAPLDALVLSHVVGARKPAAAFFDHCQHMAGFPAAQCIFIDDLPANVAGARECGWHGIVYRGLDDLLGEFKRLGIELTPLG
jgi:putative hydrolase of the HAD superfamily